MKPDSPSNEEAGGRAGAESVVETRAGRGFRRRFWILTLVTSLAASVAVGLLVDWILPLTDALKTEAPATVAEYPEYQELLPALRRQLRPAIEHKVHAKVRAVGRHEINPLLFSEFLVSLEHQQDKVVAGVERARIRLRSDRLIGAVAFILTLLLVWGACLIYVIERSREPKRPKNRLEMDLEALLVDEIEILEGYCKRVDGRAMFLLAVGIVGVIGGLGAIYYLVPLDFLVQSAGEPSRDISWLVKSFAIVAYVEGIALFLLRFHRHGTADYKYYSAQRLRGVRLLATLKLLSHSLLSYEKETQLASALLDEDPFRGLTADAGDGSGDSGSQLDKIAASLRGLSGKGPESPRA